MMDYQAGDIWRCMGTRDDGEILIVAVHDSAVTALWLVDKPCGNDYDVQLGNRYVNTTKIYTMRINALLDFVRSIPDEILEDVKDKTAKALGLNRVVITGEVQEPAGVTALKDDTIDNLQRELVKVTAQRDVFKELYLKREGIG